MCSFWLGKSLTSQVASANSIVHDSIKICADENMFARNSNVRSSPNNTPRQYYILVTQEWTKTLAMRTHFDFSLSGFRVLRFRGFRVLGCAFGKLKETHRDLSMPKDMIGYAGSMVGKHRAWFAANMLNPFKSMYDLCLHHFTSHNL